MSINNAERKQDQFNAIIGILIDGYKRRIDKYIDLKDKFLKNVKKNYQGREKTIEGFKTKIFLINMDEEERFWNEEEEKRKKMKKKSIGSETKTVLLITKGLRD